MNDGARRDTCEDAFHLGQFAGGLQGFRRPDQELPVEDLRIEDRRDEALVQRAQPVDEVAELRFGRDDLDVRVVLAKTLAASHQGAARAETGDEVGHLGQILDDLRAGSLVVGQGVVRVAVLERHEVGVLRRSHLVGDLDGAVRPLLRRRVDDLGAEEFE